MPTRKSRMGCAERISPNWYRKLDTDAGRQTLGTGSPNHHNRRHYCPGSRTGDSGRSYATQCLELPITTDTIWCHGKSTGINPGARVQWPNIAAYGDDHATSTGTQHSDSRSSSPIRDIIGESLHGRDRNNPDIVTESR